MGNIINKISYTYRDLTIVPEVTSRICHRSQCNPFDENGMLPLFTAPMDTVVNEHNFDLFESHKINAILPRTVELNTRVENSKNGKWSAYSLSEFEKVFCNPNDVIHCDKKLKVLIDVANGHMLCLFDMAKQAKAIYRDNIILMGGNIANPNTYIKYVESGFDYVRCSIGTGSGCLSSSNTGIHMPPATLICDICEIKKNMMSDKLPKIIADGGIRNYSDAIKAIALGADYVMIGSVFAQMLESAAPKYFSSLEWHRLPGDKKMSDLTNIRLVGNAWYGMYKGNEIELGNISATFYGMASKEGQIALNGSKTKTSEGIRKELYVKYTMETWVENFTDYLRSAMSYTDSMTIDELKEATLVINSESAIKSVNK